VIVMYIRLSQITFNYYASKRSLKTTAIAHRSACTIFTNEPLERIWNDDANDNDAAAVSPYPSSDMDLGEVEMEISDYYPVEDTVLTAQNDTYKRPVQDSSHSNTLTLDTPLEIVSPQDSYMSTMEIRAATIAT